MIESKAMVREITLCSTPNFPHESKVDKRTHQRECNQLSVDLKNTFITRDVIWDQVLETDRNIKNLASQIQREATQAVREGGRHVISALMTFVGRVLRQRNPFALSSVVGDFLNALFKFNDAVDIQLSSTSRMEREVNTLNFRLREHRKTLAKIDRIEQKLRRLGCKRN